MKIDIYYGEKAHYLDIWKITVNANSSCQCSFTTERERERESNIKKTGNRRNYMKQMKRGNAKGKGQCLPATWAFQKASDHWTSLANFNLLHQ